MWSLRKAFVATCLVDVLLLVVTLGITSWSVARYAVVLGDLPAFAQSQNYTSYSTFRTTLTRTRYDVTSIPTETVTSTGSNGEPVRTVTRTAKIVTSVVTYTQVTSAASGQNNAKRSPTPTAACLTSDGHPSVPPVPRPTQQPPTRQARLAAAFPGQPQTPLYYSLMRRASQSEERRQSFLKAYRALAVFVFIILAAVVLRLAFDLALLLAFWLCQAKAGRQARALGWFIGATALSDLLLFTFALAFSIHGGVVVDGWLPPVPLFLVFWFICTCVGVVLVMLAGKLRKSLASAARDAPTPSSSDVTGALPYRGEDEAARSLQENHDEGRTPKPDKESLTRPSSPSSASAGSRASHSRAHHALPA